ncbi:MAG: hypothetical protein ACLS3V_02150 [Streptococcus sp.]
MAKQYSNPDNQELSMVFQFEHIDFSISQIVLNGSMRRSWMLQRLRLFLINGKPS